MNRSIRFSNLLLSCCLCNSCCEPDNTDIPIVETTSTYVIEMDSNYKVSKYSFWDSNESYAGDMDCISEYTYYNDSIVIISDSRSVTARGDYAKGIYYLNKSGLADSSYHELDHGHLSKRFFKHLYNYDSSSYLVADSVKRKEQNSFSLYLVNTYEYSDGNLIKLNEKYIGSTPSTYTYTYTYNIIENLFSLFGTFKGKPNKNLVQTTTTLLNNGEIHSSTNDYKLYLNGLIEETVNITSSDSIKYILTINYTYNIR